MSAAAPPPASNTKGGVTCDTDGDRAVFKIHIRGSMDAVWHEITKTDEPQETFFNMWMDTTTLGPGAPIRMRNKNKKYTGVVGEVLEWEPPKRFAHTFKFTHLNDPECIVRYELEESDGGVEFKMILENLPTGTKTAKQMSQGGTMICKTLKAMVENGKPSAGTRVLFKVFRALEITSPKATRSEHWPL